MSGHAPTHDLAIVGGGAVGLASAWYAARAGLSVVLLEQDRFFNEGGGSAGAERQWRLQYSEEDLTRLVLDAVPLWRDLEGAAGRRLIHATGSLWFGEVVESTTEGQIAEAASVLDRLDLPYQWLTAAEIEHRYGFRDLPAHYEGFYQPDGGTIDVRGTLFALYLQARAAGADLREGRRVTAVEPGEAGVTLATDDGPITAERVVVAGGAYAPELLEPLGVRLDVEIYEMTTAYFRPRGSAIDYPSWFAFQSPTENDANLFYGFGRSPWDPRELIRVAPVFEANPVRDPRAIEGKPSAADLDRTGDWVRRHLPGLDPDPVGDGTCLVAVPTDHERGFYLGVTPGDDRVIVCTAGWMFKFVPLFARICVQLATDGTTDHDISRLALD